MKKFLTIIAVLTLVLGLAPSKVLANHSGPESLAVAADINWVSVLNDQYGEICNFAFTDANTGLNKTYTRGGSDTGNAVAVADVKTNLNSTDTGVVLSDSGSGPVAVNQESVETDEFGADSLNFGNIAVAVDLNAILISNFNNGRVGNVVMTLANTGGNETFKKGNSDTGNATATSLVSTDLNSNKTDVEINDSESGPIAINNHEFVKRCDEEDEDDCDECEEEQDPCDSSANFNNGPMGGDLAVAIDANIVKVVNINEGSVGNFVMTVANTGVNQTFKKGDSNTGDALAVAVVNNDVNSNETSVKVNDTGSGPVAVNSRTTEESISSLDDGPEESLAIAADVTIASVLNENHGLVMNLVGTGANTGGNTTYKGNSTTGNAIAVSTVNNNVNTNTTDVTITDSGSGPVAVNSSDNNGTGSPCVPNTPCANNGGTYAGNIGESGIAVAVDATVAVVTNENDANVVNVVGTSSNTGGNTTGQEHNQSCPSGSTTSDTGDATASTNVSNTVNTNTTTVVITK